MASTMSSLILPKFHTPNLKIHKHTNHNKFTFLHLPTKHRIISCTNATPWDPPPVKYAPKDEFLAGPTTLFETVDSSQTKTTESQTTTTKKDSKNGYLRWPMWLVGPSILLATGIIPTLWLPLSSVFLGANIATLLALTGLDCIFNLGATLFLLMSDACSRPTGQDPDPEPSLSRAPLSYRFWNTVATVSGFVLPLTVFVFSQKGVFDPKIPPISFLILLGPYLLLLAVQMLTEMLTWHWESPVWLVTPIVYEGYRVLQLMRGLKLGGEMGAPGWTVDMVRVLVCWWVLVLGVQIMRVAWYAGFTAHLHKNESSGVIEAESSS